MTPPTPPLVKAENIMSKPLVFVHTSDTVRHAAGILLDKGISGVPVLDHLERPVGVLTKTDIVRYEREYVAANVAEEARQVMRAQDTLEFVAEGRGFHRESEEDYVLRWMTPKIFTVSVRASLSDVIREMARHQVHRLFVRGQEEELAGVITTFDLLKFLARVFLVNSPSFNKPQKMEAKRKAAASRR